MNKQELKAKVAQRLITLRTQQGYSQQKVASLLGVSLTTYRNWELGKTLSDIKKYMKLAREIYHISLVELFDI